MVGWGWLYGVECVGNKPHRCGAGRAAVCAPAARGGSHAGCGLCAPAARGRGRGRERRAAERAEAGDSGAERARAAEREGTGQRDSIADGTALRDIVGEEVAATFERSRRNPRAILFLCRLRYSSVFLSKKLSE